MAERWEPYELRGSRTVLGAREGEIPSRNSLLMTQMIQALFGQGLTFPTYLIAGLLLSATYRAWRV